MPFGKSTKLGKTLGSTLGVGTTKKRSRRKAVYGQTLGTQSDFVWVTPILSMPNNGLTEKFSREKLGAGITCVKTAPKESLTYLSNRIRKSVPVTNRKRRSCCWMSKHTAKNAEHSNLRLLDHSFVRQPLAALARD